MENVQHSCMSFTDWINPSQLSKASYEPLTPLKCRNVQRRDSDTSTVTDSPISSCPSIANYCWPATPQSKDMSSYCSESGFERIHHDSVSNGLHEGHSLSTSPDSLLSRADSLINFDETPSPCHWPNQARSEYTPSKRSTMQYVKLGCTPLMLSTNTTMNIDSSSFSSSTEASFLSSNSFPSQSFWNGENLDGSQETSQFDMSYCPSLTESMDSSDWNPNLAPQSSNNFPVMADMLSHDEGQSQAFNTLFLDQSQFSKLERCNMDLPTSSSLPGCDEKAGNQSRQTWSPTRQTEALDLGTCQAPSQAKNVKLRKRRSKRVARQSGKKGAIEFDADNGTEKYSLNCEIQTAQAKFRKMYGCPDCDRRFSRSEHCKRHRLRHEPERKHGCALAKLGGSEWCNIESDKRSTKDTASAAQKTKGISRTDNQIQHYQTHLQYRDSDNPRNNKRSDKLFFFWLIARHDGKRAGHVITRVAKKNKKISEQGGTPETGEPDHELMERHPEYRDFQAWKTAGSSLRSMVELEKPQEQKDWNTYVKL